MHFNSKNITGNRYGKLVVIKPTNERNSNGSIKWECLCDCGKTYYSSSSDLKRRKSCGCKTKLNDLSGHKFGRLTVMYRSDNRCKQTYWHCKCECGKEIDVYAQHLLTGKNISCGCVSLERIRELNKTHGLSNTRLYDIWCGMKARCFNEKSKSYSIYGGRGITVCNEWKEDFISFYEWSLANGYSDDLSIDRIDADGDYEPSNCRWTDKRTQSINKRNTIYIELFGRKLTLYECCEWAKADYKKAHRRYKNGKQIFDESEMKLIKEKIENGGI